MRVIMHVLWSKMYHNVHDLVSSYKMNIFGHTHNVDFVTHVTYIYKLTNKSYNG